MPTRRARHGRVLAVTASATLIVAGLAGFSSAAGAGTAARYGHMTPASAGSYHQLVGRAEPAGTSFACQDTTPAGCYAPEQIRAAYGIDQLPQNGAGTTIAIVDAFQSPTIAQDLDTFDTTFGLPDPELDIAAPDGLTPFDQSNADQTSWAGEISLDVEWAHAVAPAAKILLVLAKSDNDPDIESALHYVVHHTDSDVLSQSYGEAEQCEDPTTFANMHKELRTAKTKNMTVFASTADQGAALPTCDDTSYFKAASTPATDPAVTAVGGTLLDADGTTGAYHGETTWNEPDFAAAGGGGYSTVYAAPKFQSKAVGKTAPGRGIPDIAYNAGIDTGVLTVWSTSGQGANLIFRFGGTSAGSPQWAGLAALADQAAGHRLGLITPQLYTLAKSSASYAGDFHDVTTGDNTYHGIDVTVPGFPAGPGWDPATGLGTPQAQNLVPALAGTAAARSAA